jgi:hypothetical protein
MYAGEWKIVINMSVSPETSYSVKALKAHALATFGHLHVGALSLRLNKEDDNLEVLE